MRVNVYAEEMTNRIEVVEKDGFVGIRFYLYLPVTVPQTLQPANGEIPLERAIDSTRGAAFGYVRGAFIHGRPDDDDSAAVTFWGKKDLEIALSAALQILREYHASKATYHPKKT